MCAMEGCVNSHNDQLSTYRNVDWAVFSHDSRIEPCVLSLRPLLGIAPQLMGCLLCHCEAHEVSGSNLVEGMILPRILNMFPMTAGTSRTTQDKRKELGGEK